MANLIEYIQSQVYENSTEDISGSIMQQVLTRMASDEGVVNVHTISGQTPFADYNNAQAARGAVPDGFKKLGLIITYKLSSGWYIDEFIGSATSGWSTASNWKCLGPISVSQNASTGKTTITIGSESFDVATQPVSVSQNTQIINIEVGGDSAKAINPKALYMVASAFSESGYYNKNTGVLTSAADMVATPLMRVRKGDIISYKVSCNGAAIVCCYNEYGTYLADKSVIQSDGNVHEDIYTVPDGVCFVALCNYTSALATPLVSLSIATPIGDRIFEMSEDLKGVKISYPFNVNAYYDLNGGKHETIYFLSTDFIPVVGGMKIDYNCGSQLDSTATILAFDSVFNVVDVLAGIPSQTQNGTYIVPENAKFVIFSNYPVNQEGIYAIVDCIQSVINIETNNHIQIVKADDFTFNGYIKNDGTYSDLSGCKCTDYLSVKDFNQIECYLNISASGFCAFYFKDKTLCSTFQVSTRFIGEIPYGAEYVRLCTFTADTPNPNAILRKVKNYWENKKFAIFGTSIEAGYPKSSFENNRKRLDTYSFWNQAVKMLGGIPLNYAVPSGFILKVAGSAQSFLGSTAADIDYGSVGIQNVNINNRLLNYIGTENDADVYVFAYHVNDTLRDASLLDDSTVDYDSTDQETFVGAYNYTLTQLFTEKPNAVVILASHYTDDGFADQAPARYKKVNDILRNLAKKWNILFVDISQSSAIVNNGFINNYTAYMTDSGHPANYKPSEGIELIGRLANAIANKLKNFG